MVVSKKDFRALHICFKTGRYGQWETSGNREKGNANFEKAQDKNVRKTSEKSLVIHE